jgi:hypothetical protein
MSMKRLKGILAQSVIVAALLMVTGLSASAQSAYYNLYIDGVYVGTQTVGSAGSGSCGWVNIWSNLNGNYQYGTSTYPWDYEIDEFASYGDTANYPWDWGYSGAACCDPYSGNCTGWSVSYNGGRIKVTHTFFSGGYAVPLGCYYPSTACTGGTSATCGSGWTLALDPGCPYYAEARFIVYDYGGSAQRCTLGTSWAATGGGACT